MAHRVTSWPVPGVILLAVSFGLASTNDETPDTYFINGASLVYARGQVQKRDPELIAPLTRLVVDADRALAASPPTITARSYLRPSSDRRDYMSIAPYWWPNPDSTDGLPYIRKDGQVNPEHKERSDRHLLARMTREVNTLAIAYYFTRNKNFAAAAAKRLRVWFIDSTTRMNPHLQFAQAVPGRSTGRAAGIIETHEVPTLFDAIALMESSQPLSVAESATLRRWFNDYLNWLINSPMGKGEAAADNNHGTWYDVQVAALAHFVGRSAIAKTTLQEFAAKRISRQIEPDGQQPRELARTRGWDYSLFNLEAHFHAANLASSVGIDLWRFQSHDRRSLRKALDWLIPFAVGEKKWPYEQISPFEPKRIAPLLRRASIAFADGSYEDALRKLPGISGLERWQLLHPAPIHTEAQ